MRNVIEIRFHGMGGQGAVMGALTLAEAAFSEGKFSQKIPVYGGMRPGGDVTVFLRLDDKPIRRTRSGRDSLSRMARGSSSNIPPFLFIPWLFVN